VPEPLRIESGGGVFRSSKKPSAFGVRSAGRYGRGELVGRGGQFAPSRKASNMGAIFGSWQGAATPGGIIDQNRLFYCTSVRNRLSVRRSSTWEAELLKTVVLGGFLTKRRICDFLMFPPVGGYRVGTGGSLTKYLARPCGFLKCMF